MRLIEVYNTNNVTVEQGNDIPLGNVVRNYYFDNCIGEVNNSSVVINKCGFYEVTYRATFTAPVAGETSFALAVNGIIIPQGVTSTTAAINTTYTEEFTTIIRILPCQNVSITIVNNGVSVNLSESDLIIKKLN